MLGCMLGCLLASSLACLPDFLRSVGHTKPNAAHCFCAVAFQGGVAASTLSCFPMLPHCLRCRELRPAASSRWLSATVPPSSSPWHSRPAVPPQRPCQQHLWHGAPASNIFPMALRHGAPASKKPHRHPRPARNLIGTPCQQQTSSGREKYSGLASNLAYLSRIC